ncbi:unnamed protein product, partial [Meganyctiphanes norvegica]
MEPYGRRTTWPIFWPISRQAALDNWIMSQETPDELKLPHSTSGHGNKYGIFSRIKDFFVKMKKSMKDSIENTRFNIAVVRFMPVICSIASLVLALADQGTDGAS